MARAHWGQFYIRENIPENELSKEKTALRDGEKLNVGTFA
jgi:hypothetical protein